MKKFLSCWLRAAYRYGEAVGYEECYIMDGRVGYWGKFKVITYGYIRLEYSGSLISCWCGLFGNLKERKCLMEGFRLTRIFTYIELGSGRLAGGSKLGQTR